jgi:hypothetical protein
MVTGSYKTQYQVNINSAGIGVNSSGTVATLNGTAFTQAQLPYGIWCDSGHLVSYAFTSPVSAGSTKRYTWSFTSGLSQTLQSNTFTVAGTGTITGTYATQYRLGIQVIPVAGGLTDPPAGSHWYDSGSPVHVSETPAVGYGFSHWNLDGSDVGSATSYNVDMNSPHDLIAVFSGNATILSAESLRITPQDTVLSKGNTATMTVTVFNSGDSSLEGNLYIEIVGPSGYIHYDTIPVSLAGKSQIPYGFRWYVPSNALAGTYRVSSGLVPPMLAAYDVKYVQVS